MCDTFSTKEIDIQITSKTHQISVNSLELELVDKNILHITYTNNIISLPDLTEVKLDDNLTPVWNHELIQCNETTRRHAKRKLTAQQKEGELWHRRMGHISAPYVHKLTQVSEVLAV